MEMESPVFLPSFTFCI
uniref:Uncharacterized protein n=1 Tax=Anguilla anguilla TaxID=7936 RepID=A0A0E9QZ93_ANGAN